VEWSGAPLEETAVVCSDLKEKPHRPEHKFNKSPACTKGTRGKVNDGDLVHDGGAIKIGKKGGLVLVA